MSVCDQNTSVEELLDQLERVSENCRTSALLIQVPPPEVEDVLKPLCHAYWDGSVQDRRLIWDAIGGTPGLLNCLLGYVWTAAERLRETGEVGWLRTGLAAAAIQGERAHHRDFLLALADLYVSAEEAGLDPEPWLEQAGGGIPAGFGEYAVVRSRRRCAS